MFEVGRVCIKLAGRDAGMKCVVVEVIDGHMVMIDGETRRRKCNVKHLEPTNQIVKVSHGASSDAVHKELGITKKEKKAKKSEKKASPKKTKAKKSKPVKASTQKKPTKAAKAAEKSE